MSILKKILFALLAFFALVFIIALVSPKDMSVKKEIVINTQPEVAYHYVTQLDNHKNFSVWQKMDPNMKLSSTGTDATVGYISSWDSENEEVGKGSQEIVKLTPNKRMDTKLRFIKPFQSEADAYFTTEPSGSGTKVSWGFDSKMPVPMNLMLYFMDMDAEVGKSFQTGLTNLKGILEAQPASLNPTM